MLNLSDCLFLASPAVVFMIRRNVFCVVLVSFIAGSVDLYYIDILLIPDVGPKD